MKNAKRRAQSAEHGGEGKGGSADQGEAGAIANIIQKSRKRKLLIIHLAARSITLRLLSSVGSRQSAVDSPK
ncbi:MAG TPA: hypothetical protein ENN86_02225 [Desulfobacteraceae bacterium]|nr:hypothetical protein [Desulfobacteraceae bacterium]